MLTFLFITIKSTISKTVEILITSLLILNLLNMDTSKTNDVNSDILEKNINYIQDKPFLHNYPVQNYQTDKWMKSLDEFAKTINMTGSEVIKKIKYFQTQYSKQKKKFDIRNGSESDDISSKIWIWYKQCHFLRDEVSGNDNSTTTSRSLTLKVCLSEHQYANNSLSTSVLAIPISTHIKARSCISSSLSDSLRVPLTSPTSIDISPIKNINRSGSPVESLTVDNIVPEPGRKNCDRELVIQAIYEVIDKATLIMTTNQCSKLLAKLTLDVVETVTENKQKNYKIKTIEF